METNDVFPCSSLLSMGAIAGSISALLTNPLDVITVRLMTQRVQNSNLPIHTTMRSMFYHIITQEGYKGFIKGALPRILHVTPNTSITFALYEMLQTYVFKDTSLDSFFETG